MPTPEKTFTAEQTAELNAALARITLKKMVAHPTSDGSYLKADIYFDGKLLDTFVDEGHGGGAYPLSFNSVGGKAFMDFYNTSDIRKLMLADWDFLDYDSTTPDTVAGWLIDKVFNAMQEEKRLKALARHTQTKLSWEDENGDPTWFNFKGFKDLNALAKAKGGIPAIQKSYDKKAAELKNTSRRFLTPVSLLTSLGINVLPELHRG